MKLFYAKPSRYARRVWVLLRERGMLSHIDEMTTAPWDSPVGFLAVNPVSKAPALVPDNGTLLTKYALIATHLNGPGHAARLSAGGAMRVTAAD